MEVSTHGKKQANGRKVSSKWAGAHNDLWFVVRQGSLSDVDSALAVLKKTGTNINSRNIFGLTPLHIAVWRNHIPIARRLLAAGADPDARDGESGWSSLHRALHFGHLAVASILLQSGASITLEDSKFRIPVDLISGPVLQVLGNGQTSVTTEVFSWGSGVNYQLGTGNAHIQKLPCKVDALHDSLTKVVSASKFHSVAVTARGEVYTWGFGRGGRLGQPDFDIHSGQAAVITPRQVSSGLGARLVKAVAAAKHHTVIATNGGEVFTWGSNREGQLGYTSVDTQPTPRRVSSLRSKIVAVAAANKHTAVVSDIGEVFTWGGNREGQLGYGTSNSASNYTPRVVDYLKGKVLMGVAAAKFHTIVLGAEGEVYTWGHRLVTPKRVVVARNLKKSGNTTLKFHRKERLNVISVAAGVVHSVALTDDGALFYWMSSDPTLRTYQLYSLCGKTVVNISAGKYWTAAVTATGDVYMCDGKNVKDKPPVATRLHGIKRATSVSVGETHLLIIGSLYQPAYAPSMAKDTEKLSIIKDDVEVSDEDLLLNDKDSENHMRCTEGDARGKKGPPSLKSLCEKVAAEKLVEPRNAIQLLEIAVALVADDLRKYCEDIAIRNLEYIFTVSSQAIAGASPDILANLENSLDSKSSEAWSYRRLPTPTATLPAVIYSEEDDSESEFQRTRDSHTKQFTSKNEIHHRPGSFLEPRDDLNQGTDKEIRALRKKLQQIEMLEAKQSNGHLLDDQQIKKLQTKSDLESSLAERGVQIETPQSKASSSVLPDAKANEVQLSRKQRRKSKQIATQLDMVSRLPGPETEPNTIKGFLNLDISQTSKNKEEDPVNAEVMTSQATKVSVLCAPKEKLNSSKNSSSSPTVSKKKNRKGGLSMFLSGALDDSPKYNAPPPPTPKSEGPAWGGAKISQGFSSLRDIQHEQIKIKEFQPTNKDHLEDSLVTKSGGRIQLSSYLPSKPIPVGSGPVVLAPDSLEYEGERSTPPWTASGTPPLLSRPSLRDIQLQQKGKQQSMSHSPKTKSTGFSISNGQGSPSDSSGSNRWFKPELDAPSSIRSIQIEEKAMKDLRRFYSSVKVVKNP